ncbi:transcription cofactor vestigial-like protein 3 [Xyrauchen texanus]|uniref:transcription cofactor vestigial-like protein 3 n=1 Tax=Xyrauchen texanus TaxID=154827 RepID=UPI002241E323|nr:transcription cofactor vestigial-like protein 3 [Xyrauchen texanus]
MMEDRQLERSEAKDFKDRPQLFTYYQGDINTAVDEHFFRALNRSTIPKDLSTKAKDSNRTSDVSPSSSSSWASGLAWSKSSHYSNPSKLTQLTSIDNSPPSQGVIMNPPGISSASSLWPCTSRQGTAFELPLSLYQQPAAAESRASSYMNLLQIERQTGGIMISPFSKSDARPEWNAGAAFKDTSGSRIGLDSGVPVAEISKDLYWY